MRIRGRFTWLGAPARIRLSKTRPRRRNHTRRPQVDGLEPRQLMSYSGAPTYAIAYNPTWPHWAPKAGTQLEDSDFATAAFQGLWGTVHGKGRNDLQTIKDAGFNTVRLYNWGPSREGRTADGKPTGKFDGHLPFLDTSQSLGLKVIVPVSNYFLSNDQYAWNGHNPDPTFSLNSAPAPSRSTSISSSLASPRTAPSTPRSRQSPSATNSTSESSKIPAQPPSWHGPSGGS